MVFHANWAVRLAVRRANTWAILGLCHRRASANVPRVVVGRVSSRRRVQVRSNPSTSVLISIRPNTDKTPQQVRQILQDSRALELDRG
jgi:hypothetical protein